MELDQNEKRLIEKIVAALYLVNATGDDIEKISQAKKVDDDFLKKAGKIFENTDACDVCRHAFYGWRHTLDDETVFSFIDDWIKWKKEKGGDGSKARVVQMKRKD